jgi:N utilization substance protein B
MAEHKKNKPAKSADKKANRRGSARLAAVQALYQMDIAGAGINDIFAEFESHWLGGEVEGDKYLPAEAAFFRDVVSGVVRDQAKARSLDRRCAVEGLAAEADRRHPARGVARRRLTSWSIARTYPAASWYRNMSTSRMPLSRREETGMVNAVLDQIARQFRAERVSCGPGARMIAVSQLRGRYGSECCAGHTFRCRHPRKRVIPYAAAPRFITSASGILGRPVKPGDDSCGLDRHCHGAPAIR